MIKGNLKNRIATYFLLGTMGLSSCGPTGCDSNKIDFDDGVTPVYSPYTPPSTTTNNPSTQAKPAVADTIEKIIYVPVYPSDNGNNGRNKRNGFGLFKNKNKEPLYQQQTEDYYTTPRGNSRGSASCLRCDNN